MDIKLIDRNEVAVAYLRHLGPYDGSLSRFWRESVGPWMVANKLAGRARYGICHDDPATTAPEQCRYDAAVEVDADFVATGGTLCATIPGGRYAVLGFKGTHAEIGAAWATLLRELLPASGLQLDARPCFEYYPVDAGFDAATGVFECEICAPVRRP